MRVDEATALAANQHKPFHSRKVCKLRKRELSDHKRIGDLIVLLRKKGNPIEHFSVAIDGECSQHNSEHSDVLKTLDIHIALHQKLV